MPLEALIFDVDGTLAETKELHRAAFNAVFLAQGLDWHWDTGLYGQLLGVTGGKERLRHYCGLTQVDMPETRIARLHELKNLHLRRLDAGGSLRAASWG